MPSYEIRKDVAPPTRTYRRSTSYPWAAMEIGDSVLIDDKKAGTIRHSVMLFQKQSSRKFTVRTTPEGVGVWRTE
jgi:hypothetical protein